MTVFKQCYKIFVLTFMGLTLCMSAFAESIDPQKTLRLQQLLDQTRNKYHFPAMALTIIMPNAESKPVNFLSGSTENTNGRALRDTDYFQIGSNTKSFVAALLLKLQSEQKISLDEKITKWFPQYTKWNNVTVRNLLNNNSGIPSYTKSKKFLAVFDKHPEQQFTPKELVNYAYAQTILFKPQQGWDYSNTNWIIAGMIAEKVTNSSLNQLFTTYLFQKNHLKDIQYIPTHYAAKELARLVHGYDDQGKDITKRNMSWASAAGAIIASNQDLARWAYALFKGQALNENERHELERIVSTRTGKVITPSGSEQEGYGLGVGLRKNAVGAYWGHEGQTEGYHSIFAYFPDQQVTIAMSADGIKDADFHTVLKQIMTILHGSS